MTRGERLLNLGFTQTPDAQKYIVTKEQIVKSKEEADVIMYYKRRYPFNKFLTEAELERICNKYNLVHAPISAYKGNVPDKNIREIENAPLLNSEDRPSKRLWCEVVYHSPSSIGVTSQQAKKLGLPTVIEGENFTTWSATDRYLREKYKVTDVKYISDSVINYSESRDGLFICAPKSDFNLDNLANKGLGFFNLSTFEIKDPIVYRYVRGGVQVLSKWGLEASDEALLNEIDN